MLIISRSTLALTKSILIISLVVVLAIVGAPSNALSGGPEPPISGGAEQLSGPATVGRATITPVVGDGVNVLFEGRCGSNNNVVLSGTFPFPFEDLSVDALLDQNVGEVTHPSVAPCYSQAGVTQGRLIINTVTRLVIGESSATAEVVILAVVPL